MTSSPQKITIRLANGDGETDAWIGEHQRGALKVINGLNVEGLSSRACFHLFKRCGLNGQLDSNFFELMESTNVKPQSATQAGAHPGLSSQEGNVLLFCPVPDGPLNIQVAPLNNNIDFGDTSTSTLSEAQSTVTGSGGLVVTKVHDTCVCRNDLQVNDLVLAVNAIDLCNLPSPDASIIFKRTTNRLLMILRGMPGSSWSLISDRSSGEVASDDNELGDRWRQLRSRYISQFVNSKRTSPKPSSVSSNTALYRGNLSYSRESAANIEHQWRLDLEPWYRVQLPAWKQLLENYKINLRLVEDDVFY